MAGAEMGGLARKATMGGGEMGGLTRKGTMGGAELGGLTRKGTMGGTEFRSLVRKATVAAMAADEFAGMTKKQREDAERQRKLREGALKFRAQALGYVQRRLREQQHLAMPLATPPPPPPPYPPTIAACRWRSWWRWNGGRWWRMRHGSVRSLTPAARRCWRA